MVRDRSGRAVAVFVTIRCIGTWERRWTTLRPRCAGTVSPVVSLQMSFVWHAGKVSYVRKIFWFLGRDSNIDVGIDWLSVCSLGRPFDRFYLTRDAADWLCVLNLKRRQRTNAKGARFVGWHNLEVFAIPLRERDAFYCPVKDVCKNDEGSRTFGVPTSIVFSYLTNKIQSGSAPMRDFLQKVLEDEFDMMKLSAFVRCARYGSSKRLVYPSMIAGCADHGVLLRVDLSTIKL